MPSTKNGNGTFKLLIKIVAVILTPLVFAGVLVVSFRAVPWTAQAAGLVTQTELDTVRCELATRLDSVDERQSLVLKMQFYGMLQASNLPDYDREMLRRKVEYGVMTLDSAAIYLMTR